MSQHPFTHYLRIIGKGRHGSRPLNREEAKLALGMILDNETLPQQVSAFFVLIRIREETPDEAAGFVDAIRQRLPSPSVPSAATIDWGTYAGKRRHPPWFLLAAKALAQQSEKILLHGIIGPSSNRLYTQQAISALEIPLASSIAEAETELNTRSLCYLPLENYYPPLRQLLHLQEILGLRTPLHSVARMLNPLNAPLSVHGVFHRKFDEVHQQTASILNDNNVLAFRGEGGEAEIRPEVKTSLRLSRNGGSQTIEQPSISPRAVPASNNDLNRLCAVWEKQQTDTYGEQAVIATMAAIRTAQNSALADTAIEWARDCWASRA